MSFLFEATVEIFAGGFYCKGIFPLHSLAFLLPSQTKKRVLLTEETSTIYLQVFFHQVMRIERQPTSPEIGLPWWKKENAGQLSRNLNSIQQQLRGLLRNIMIL